MTERDAACKPSPEPILRHAYGFWASAILAAAIKHEIFRHLEEGPCAAPELARRAGISERGAQALLDGLLGLELVEGDVAQYGNTPLARSYLLPGTRHYLGGYANLILATFGDWPQLVSVVATGEPLHTQEGPAPDNPYWEDLDNALAPLGYAPAERAAEKLGLRSGERFRMLDVGGGAGAYSSVWLAANGAGECVQLDWPNVNRIARRLVDETGNGHRFSTVDGDMESIELPTGHYDHIVYSNVANGLSAERNTRMFGRARNWLRPGGTLLVAGVMEHDDRTGHPLVLMFASNMILNTKGGFIHVRSDYVQWLQSAGFSSIEFETLDEYPLTLIYAS